MADVAALTGNQQYIIAINKIWENVVGKKYYITGGIGAKYEGEAFGNNYELPNHAYNETCAAIANVFWNQRMFLMNGDSKYIDVLERTLYNAVLPGISFEGNTFFYPNVLEFNGEELFNQGAPERKPWFDCSCCPSNLSRFIPSVPNYIYAQKGDQIFANLFVASKTKFDVNKNALQIVQETNYPWEGNIKFKMKTEKPVKFSFNVRVPGWAVNKPVPGDLYAYIGEPGKQVRLFVNNKPIEFNTTDGYILIDKTWNEGDVVELVLPMETRKVIPNDNIKEITGKVAIERGPIVYCAEQVDNPEGVLNKTIAEETLFIPKFESNLLQGIVKLQSDDLTMVPYYAWSHRGLGEMEVWFNK
jgi:DUF1680 family protein